ncbi:hypothetical protein MAHJHV57_51560 [Mycobacterium avium subsp. hominissuis]
MRCWAAHRVAGDASGLFGEYGADPPTGLLERGNRCAITELNPSVGGGGVRALPDALAAAASDAGVQFRYGTTVTALETVSM